VARRGNAATAVGTLAGGVLAAVVGDPTRAHPVPGLGCLATLFERRTWGSTSAAGAVHVATLITPVAVMAAMGDRALRRRPVSPRLFGATLTWTVLGAARLRRHAVDVERAVGSGDLPTARRRLAALCGRDASALDAVGRRRALIESVAANTSDAAVAPLVWGAPAGLAGYRALPARITAVLAAALAPSVGGSPAWVVPVWRRDSRSHPSPNAGVCEAAFAGVLDLRLGGPLRYGYGPSVRPRLGSRQGPAAGDVGPVIALPRRIVASAAGLASAATWRWAR
jgi:adenosylcobinamide-phosphate synthase